MIISLIAAVAENYVIGKDGDLPWRLPADLKWFKKHTVGKTCLMGRKTYESLGFPLPSRRIIVISSQPIHGCEHASSIEKAMEMAQLAESEELMILGGSGLYNHFLPVADRFYLTVVHATPEGDTFFPAIHPQDWKASLEEFHPADEKNLIPHTFFILERVGHSSDAPSDELLADFPHI